MIQKTVVQMLISWLFWFHHTDLRVTHTHTPRMKALHVLSLEPPTLKFLSSFHCLVFKNISIKFRFDWVSILAWIQSGFGIEFQSNLKQMKVDFNDFLDCLPKRWPISRNVAVKFTRRVFNIVYICFWRFFSIQAGHMRNRAYACAADESIDSNLMVLIGVLLSSIGYLIYFNLLNQIG